MEILLTNDKGKEAIRHLKASLDRYERARQNAIDNIARLLSKTSRKQICFQQQEYEIMPRVDWLSKLYISKGVVKVRIDSFFNNQPVYAALSDYADIDVRELTAYLYLTMSEEQSITTTDGCPG